MQFLGLQGVEDRLQEVCKSLLHNNRRQGLERARSIGTDAILRRSPG